MLFAILGVLFLAFIVVLKVVKGVFKLVLILILLGLVAGTFANKDHIESAPAPVAAPAA